MDIRNVSLTEVIQRAGGLGSTSMSSSLNTGTNGGVTHSHRADIVNFTVVLCKTHPGKSLTIEPVVVPLDVVHDR